MAIYRGPGGSGDATNDATSQSIIATQAAIEAAESAIQAAASAVSASNSATAASNSASVASASATNASNFADDAADYATAAASALDEFTDLYLGAKTTNPSLDNDGNALQTGALYFNTVANEFRVYTGIEWQVITVGAVGDSVITQRFSGDGSTVAFTLSTEPFSENSTFVYINGAYQQKNTYSVSGLTLTFSEAPPSGTDNIEVLTITMVDIDTITASIININDAGGYYASSKVEGALQEAATFTQSGTGAVLRTKIDKLKETVSVKDFGAVGDGVTDDTAAIQAALDYLNDVGGGTLYIPGGDYVCMDTLTGYTKTKVIGDPNTTLDFSQRSSPLTTGDSGLFVFRGTASSPILLTSNADYGANFFTVADISPFAVGDLVEISMNAAGSFVDSSVAVKSGQLNIVTGVYPSSGNKLVVDTEMFEVLGYTTANGARIRKITPVEDVIIDTIKIKGVGRQVSGAGDLGLRVFFGKNVTIQNCVFEKIDAKSVEPVSCYHFKIDNCDVYLDQIGDNTTVSYGISYSTSMYGTISNNKVINARHGIVSSHLSTALTNDYYGVSRFIVIENNEVTGNHGQSSTTGWTLAHAGISTHTDVEFVTITKNTISGCKFGINPRTFNITISENEIIGNFNYGIYMTGDTTLKKISILNNRIIGNGNGANAIGYDSNTDDYAHDDMTVSGNYFSNCGPASIAGSSSVLSKGLRYTNNTFDNCLAVNQGALYVIGKFTGVVANNVINGCPSGYGIQIRTATGLLITGNHVYNTPVGMSIASDAMKCIVANNTFSKITGAINNASTTTTISGNINLGSGDL